MRTAPMCFSVLRVPRCQVYSWVNTWWNGFDSVSKACKDGHNLRLLSSSVCEQRANRRWTRRPITTKVEGRSKKVLSGAANIRHGIVDEIITNTTSLNIKKTDEKISQQIQGTDFRQLVAENKELAELATFIIFDLETTGLSRDYSRIIEIGLRDMAGGEKSTFHTLVNPGCIITNTEFHGIKTEEVRKPGVPRMEELIPILLQFIKFRQKPDGFVVFVAHNARSFDVRFMAAEFKRCSVDIPSNWLFLDSLPLSRQVMKLKGIKSADLQFLREHYGIKLEGSAHRAMSDVDTLALVFQRLLLDAKLSKVDLIPKTFTANELVSTSTKKKKESD